MQTAGKRMPTRAGAWFVAIAVALLPASHGLRAEGLVAEVKIGALWHDIPGLWSGFQLESDAVDINLEVQFKAVAHFWGGSLRPVIGGTINTRGDTSKGYVDARWETGAPTGIFFALGIGAGMHDGVLGPTAVDRKALGSRVLFHFPVELGWRWENRHSVSLYFEHFSNGYTQKYNEGIDGLGLRYGLRF